MIFLRRRQDYVILPFQRTQPLMRNTAKKCSRCKKCGLILHEQNFVHEVYECKFCGEVLQTYSIWLRIAVASPIFLILAALIFILIF
jgi:hypothetical protein